MRTLNFDLQNWHYRNHLKNRAITILARALLNTSHYDRLKTYYTKKQTQNAFASSGHIDRVVDYFQVRADEPTHLFWRSYQPGTFQMEDRRASGAGTFCNTAFWYLYRSPSIPQWKIKRHKNDDKTTNKISRQNDFRCMCRYSWVLQFRSNRGAIGLRIAFFDKHRISGHSCLHHSSDCYAWGLTDAT